MSELRMGGSLINLGELSKPATVLIEKISDAVGGIAKPWHIRRVATAEAKADLVRAQTRIEISELEERALLRMVREEGKKQENIESITEKAIPHILPDAKPESVEDDWITHFFDRGRLVSNAEMQTVWASILAGEATRPGSFAKKTVDLVATLDMADANLFAKLCTFAWDFCGISVFVHDEKHKIFNDCGINFETLTHLDNIGLITFNSISGFGRHPMPNKIFAAYYGRLICIELPAGETTFHTGRVMLTRAGLQLAPVCGSLKSDPYFTFMLDCWLERNYILSSPVPQPIPVGQT